MSSHIIVHDRKFRHLSQSNAALEQIATGMLWTEGPVYFAQGDYYLWSDIPNNRVYQWAVGQTPRVFDYDADNCNGHTVDLQGRLITCEHLGRRVSRREHDGSRSVIADGYAGRRLNSPNDVVVKSDGSIWFTDPSYGILSDYEGKRSPQEQDGCFVFCAGDTPDNPRVVADDFVKPNGLAFSPDETLLYISDTGLSHDPDGPHHIRVFDVAGDNSLSNGRVFVEIDAGVSDGFRMDIDGNLWTSCATGVQCFDPGGVMLGEILVPEVVSNLCFGGPKKNQLLLTATTSVYTIYVAATGC
ncbi:MAG: gluconolactonase [Paracoccaceae bacterium]|jgi:gluconolactonase